MDVKEKIAEYTKKVAEIDKNRTLMQGKYEATMEVLKKKYGTTTLEEVEALEKDTKAKKDKAVAELETNMKEFEELYGHLLEA